MRIDLFGPPRLFADGEERRHPSRKAMALVAYLAMRAGEPVTRQHLADLLWGEAEAEQARTNLRQCLAQVRGLLGAEGAAALVAEGDRLRLDAGPFDIPARRVAPGMDTDAAAMIAAGPGFLEGFAVRSDGFETWMAAERHLIETRLADALEAGGGERLAAGDAAGAALAYALALKLDPFREPVHRGLMQAQADLGRTAAALAQFDRCRAVLKAQLGVEPEAATRELAARIRAARLRKPAAAGPVFERFAADASVAVWRETAGGLREVARGPAAEALQLALDAVRAGPAPQAARLAAVAEGGDAGREQAAARAVLGRHAGPGIAVGAEVFGMFANWSPFTFEPLGQGADAPSLLLGEIPRHRMQIAPTLSRPAARQGAGVSLVVLPFRDHSPEAGRLNLGDVMSEEIIARLARFRHLAVAAPTAGQTCRALGLSVEQVHERLGVGYAVDGSVARIGDRLAVTYSITDLRAGRLVHGDRFEGRFHDLFEQQGVIVDRIATNLFHRTQDAEIDRLAARMTNDIGAYELFLAGLSSHRRGGIALHFAREAAGYFERAIEVDPGFVRAHAFRICATSWFAPEVVNTITFGELDRLVAMDDNDAEIHRISGALHQIRGHHDVALAHIDRAVELNPADAYLIANAAITRAYSGDAEGALRMIERAMAVDPFLPSWCVEEHGVVLYALGDFAGAVRALRRLTVPSPRALGYLAAALVAEGALADAAGRVEQIRRIAPDYRGETLMQFAAFRDGAIREGLRARLRQAGLD